MLSVSCPLPGDVRFLGRATPLFSRLLGFLLASQAVISEYYDTMKAERSGKQGSLERVIVGQASIDCYPDE